MRVRTYAVCGGLSLLLLAGCGGGEGDVSQSKGGVAGPTSASATSGNPRQVAAPGAVNVPAYDHAAQPSSTVPAQPNATPVGTTVQSLAHGRQVFAQNCASCHTGPQAALPLGDQVAWKPRMGKGKEVLYQNTVNGYRGHPARGGNAALTDEDLRHAMDYMLSQASGY